MQDYVDLIYIFTCPAFTFRLILMVLFHTVTIGLWFFQYVHYSGGTNKMETFPKLMRIILINRKSAKQLQKTLTWYPCLKHLNCIVKPIYWKIINSGCLLVLTLTMCCPVLKSAAVTLFSPTLFFCFFLAGSTTCKNPEESDHVRLLPWAWCVRHQWPFPAGKDTSSPVYAAVFKSAISDIGCSGTSSRITIWHAPSF